MSARTPETLAGGLGASIVIVLAFMLLQILLASLFADLQPWLGLDEMALGELAQVLAVGLVVSTVLVWRGLSQRRLLHDAPTSPAGTLSVTAAPLLALLPLLWLANGWMDSLLQAVFPLSAWEAEWFARATSASGVEVISACVLAPVLEEMLFRALILRGLLTRYPPSTAIIHSAALFGLAHLNIYQFTVGFSTGLLLGLAWQRTRSLWPCVLLHAGFNAGVVWMAQPDGRDLGQLVMNPLALPVFALLFAWGLKRLLRLPAQGSRD